MSPIPVVTLTTIYAYNISLTYKVLFLYEI